MPDSITPIRSTTAIGQLVFQALSVDPNTYTPWVVYCKLADLTTQGVHTWTYDSIAEALGTSRTVVARSVRILRTLGVLRDIGRDTEVVTQTTSRKLIRVLEAVSNRSVQIDVRNGRITHLESGKLWDATTQLETPDSTPRGTIGEEDSTPRGTHSTPRGTHSTPRGTHSTPGGTFPDAWPTPRADATVRDATGYAVSESAQPSVEVVEAGEKFPISSSYTGIRNTKEVRVDVVKKYVGNAETDDAAPTPPYDYSVTNAKDPAYCRISSDNLPLKGFDPARDPCRADIDAIIAYANDQWGTRHGVYDRRGQPNERYRHIWRALAIWGATVDQFRQAIDVVPTHHYWGPKQVRDLSKFLTKQKNWDDLVDYRKPVGERFDRRALDCAPTESNDVECITF